MSTSRAKSAQKYESIQNKIFLARIILIAGLLGVYQFSGASQALAVGLENRFGEAWYLINALYILVSILGFASLLFPLTFYSEFLLEHRFEQSNQDLKSWVTDYIKSLLIDLLVAVIFFGVIYTLLHFAPQTWWIYACGFYVLFAVVLSIIAPIYIMPLFNKFTPLEESELTTKIEQIMRESGIEVVGVFKWGLEEKTKSANAAFTGLGRTKRIILGDTLLEGYTQDEIIAILSHEVGHYKNKDIGKMLAIGSLMAIAGFYISDLCLHLFSQGLGFDSIANIGAMPLFIFCLFIFSLISMPLSNLHSRKCEYAADEYAVRTMNSANPLISALEKLADQNLANKTPAAWIEFLLHSHPSLGHRIERARQMELDLS